MNETAGMLEARLELIERIRRVEHALALREQSTTAAALMRGRAHDLGNAVQVLKLATLELARRIEGAETRELIDDMRKAADQATAVLTGMIAATHPLENAAPGPVVTHAVRAAVELARPAVPAPIELRIEVDDTVHTRCTLEELEAIVIATILEAAHATRITLVLRERVIQNKRWFELMRFDDRQNFGDGELAHRFEAHGLLHVISAAAKQAGGEASLAPGRGGLELVVELPIVSGFADPQSSSSS